jgi:hypothetical protein
MADIKQDANYEAGEGRIIKIYTSNERDMIKNRNGLVQAKVVAELTGNEFERDEKKLRVQVREYFDSIGNCAYNDKLGDIGLTHQSVRDDIYHGYGRLKAATFKAIPNVLKNGEIINYAENHKNRGYDTAIIAAPVNIAGKRHYVAALIRRDINQAPKNISQRFTLHEVYTDKKTSRLFESVRHLLQGGEHRSPDAYINNKITDSTKKVNTLDKNFLRNTCAG